MGRWLILLAVAGCAQSTKAGPDEQHDLSLQDAMESVDLGGVLGGGQDSGTLTFGDGGTCAPRINELQTSVAGDSHWEFVEIYNPCAADFPLAGWTLVYRSATNLAPRDGNDSGTLYSFTQTIAQNGFITLAGSTFTGPNDGMMMGLGLADDGAIGLRDPAARLADSVAFGAVSAGHAFIEGMPATKPPRTNAPGNSIARRPDGYDSNDNATDFVAATPTPGGHN
jgi:hypothetical protein